uniref:Aspartyl/asparaginyl beta-hydroxylase n=1 Tax=Clandestinovirus TaxID=2831644 RepID=A0A8F8PK64_9VIRU|nr:aspartyl/asparaginyl beta-hydroxylase [Clandestinovirus]
MSTNGFYDQQIVYPSLQIISQRADDIRTEVQLATHSKDWTPWPENLWDERLGHRWSVIPLFAFGKWATKFSSSFPKTCQLLSKLPNLRTALFSKMGPKTVLKSHTGWDQLANTVLRCHLGLKVPLDGKSGVWVNGVKQSHTMNEWLVFDDSLLHSGYNMSDEERIVLIIDLDRPAGVPPGTAKGGYTKEVMDLISKTIGILPE